MWGYLLNTKKNRKNWLVSAPDCCWLPVGLVAEALALLASRWRNLSLVANRLWRTGSLVAPSRYFFTSQVLPPEEERKKGVVQEVGQGPPNRAPQKPFNGLRHGQGSCWEEKKRKVWFALQVNLWFSTDFASLIVFDCLRPPWSSLKIEMWFSLFDKKMLLTQLLRKKFEVHISRMQWFPKRL